MTLIFLSIVIENILLLIVWNFVMAHEESSKIKAAELEDKILLIEKRMDELLSLQEEESLKLLSELDKLEQELEFVKGEID